MKISYSTILSNQNLIPELFIDNRWKSITIDEKKEIIYSIFHIRNWKALEPQYRIYILQELENINAHMQKRDASKLVLKEDMKGSINTGPNGSEEIHINSKYVLNGIKYYVTLQEDGTNIIQEKLLDNENVELCCSICHEGEHKKQETGIKNSVNTKEINECYLNVLNNPNNEEENNRISPNDSIILYKLQPVEYYAFLNSENMTKDIFSMLQTKFGIDEGFTKWAQRVKKDSFETLADIWNKDNNMKESAGIEYTVVGLRKKIINVMLNNMQQWYNIDSCFEACRRINLDYHDYSPKIEDDLVLDDEVRDEI